MLFFLIRHSDPIYNPDSLTPLGHRQAEAVAKRLSVYGLDRIYASTSERARLTSVPTCEVLKKEAELLEWCREGNAWQELSVEYAPGKRRWGFMDPEITALFNSPEMRELGMKWHTHPRFEGHPMSGGVERIRREKQLAIERAQREEEERKEQERQAILAEEQRKRDEARKAQDEKDTAGVKIYQDEVTVFLGALAQRLAMREEEARRIQQDLEQREQERQRRLAARMASQ